MVRKIVWTKNAAEDFRKVVEYLQNNWSERIAINFIETFYATLELIDKLPEIGVIVNKKGKVRQILITKHNLLYFIITEKEIILLNLFDVRQNPEKDKFKN